ncbi:MAG: alpha/beta hydrolase fold domain-containing protein, partial [Ilumatobacteraceae bacterium]
MAPTRQPDVDVVVVGAGFAGLYLLLRLRRMGFTAVAFESADDVGGTWYWNRYPGARCDVQSVDYSYSFDPDLDAEWEWSEKYATQPEILRYLGHVADRHGLRRDIRFSTKVDGAEWLDDESFWRVRTDRGDDVTCRFYVMATGCLSMPKVVDVEGVDRFAGEVYATSRWPHEGVDFSGKRVAVIGTGSSGIQSIPIIAEESAALTVFQRTPNFSVPARNGPIPAGKRAAIEDDRAAYREAARWSRAGVPTEVAAEGALMVSEDERRARYEAAWEEGTIFAILGAFNDIIVNADANATAAEFVRTKIRSIVDDPDTAEALCPSDYPMGTKRLCLDTGYYETFNLPHVELVDLRREPIETITETGIATTDRSFEFDAIVFATGFDAMTGAIVAVDIAGREGVKLADRWADGPLTYLGLTSVGFPNLFMITGPQSPSVLSNMAVSIEQHVDWVCDTIEHLRGEGLDTIEPTADAEAGWVQHTNDFADITLFPRANSWYVGANVPGKPRVVLPYVGGVDRYRAICDDAVERGYYGFTLSGRDGARVNDGVIQRVQPDVLIMLEMMAELGLPPMNTMPVADARAFYEAVNAQRPRGPEVGEVVDGTLPGGNGENLAYRLFRPPTPGPHPIVVYFHGGGWVLGSAVSDEPFCRDLCVQSDAVVVSVDYRHAPEHGFPVAPYDAYAAAQWIAANAAELGGITGR